MDGIGLFSESHMYLFIDIQNLFLTHVESVGLLSESYINLSIDFQASRFYPNAYGVCLAFFYLHRHGSHREKLTDEFCLFSTDMTYMRLGSSFHIFFVAPSRKRPFSKIGAQEGYGGDILVISH